jgi:hypothetical protein
LTINHLPDELLLEIFDSYRRQCMLDLHLGYVWYNLAHVCRNWRAVVFGSVSRLDLGITVRPEKPDDIKTILSGSLPIFISYRCIFTEMTDSALWRMRVVLRHHYDRVRKISFSGSIAWYDKFFEATNHPFPMLESLDLRVGDGEVKLPDTFLRGPDRSDLHLRRLSMMSGGISLASTSGFLLSATALTDLFLRVDTAYSPSAATSLFTCLQGMPFLRHLDLSMSSSPLDSQLQRPSTPKHIVPLSKLTRFHYVGPVLFLDALVAGLLAPSLRDVGINVWIVHSAT